MKAELLTIFWGERHLEMLYKTLVPSLLGHGNIPALLQSCELVHRIYCTPSEVAGLELYCKLATYPVEIITGVITPDNHSGLCEPVKESIRRGVLTVMAPCDHVFGSGLWDTIKDLKPGEYLVCGHPRIDADKLPLVHDFLKSVPDDQNRTLVRFCMNEVAHPMVQHGKSHREPYWHVHDKGDHWQCHFAEPPPLAWWGSPYMLSAWSGFILFTQWEVIDHEMVEHCRQAGMLRTVTDSRQFFWAEFTEHKTYNPRFQPPLQSSFRYEAMTQMQTTPLRWYK
jgi:hypothetical protein